MEFSSKSMLVFDYREFGIVDSTFSNYEDIQLFKNVIKKLNNRLEEMNSCNYKFNKIKINFSENYIGNDSITELREFLEKNKVLQNHLISLDISNTQITSSCFFEIEKILNICSKIQINISYNNILLKEFKQKFVGKFERVIFKY